MSQDDTALLIVALIALGMALAFVIADRDSPISHAMSAALAATGVSVALNVLVAAPLHARHEEPPWDGVFALPETLAFVFAFEWLLRVLRTIPAEQIEEEKWLRLAQGLALLYGALSLAFPHIRTHEFVNVLRHDPADIIHLPSFSGFLLFAGPLAASHLCAAYAGLHAYRKHPDRAETRRVLAFLAGAPFLLAGMILPLQAAPFAAATGLIVFLVGAVQFHVTQGRRAEFISRFLAPQVAQLVANQGLERATAVRTLDISIVVCDLRGFTAYSVATTPLQVIEILREYYDAVGAAAARCGATIKDQAGDGVLMLIGAPLAFPDHAVRAVHLAEDILHSAREVTSRRSDGDLRLGIGAGVASGPVSVGVIGAKSRLEYTAVGPAVNLASRLCGEAADGEILIAQETREKVRADPVFESIGPARDLALKGIGNAVASYTLARRSDRLSTANGVASASRTACTTLLGDKQAMSQEHTHAIPTSTNERSLMLALGLTGTFLIAEVVAGIVFNSLALLSDAAHMFTDAAALAIGLAAIRVARRVADAKRTYGYQRFEILAAAFNALLLFGVAIYILYEAYQRFRQPVEVQTGGMLLVAFLGLAINLISMKLLSAGKDKSLNVKGAYLEVWSDMLGSVGVIVAAIAIRFTGWAWLDTLIAVAIGLWVLPRTWVLLKESLNILLEGVPDGLAVNEIQEAILKVPGVASLHELHVWALTSGRNSLSVHVVNVPGTDITALLTSIRQALATKFEIFHSTIQCEAIPCGQSDLDWNSLGHKDGDHPGEGA